MGERALVSRPLHTSTIEGGRIPRDNIQVVFDQSEPHSTGLLRVDDVHEIYWEESGRTDGIPAVYLHCELAR